MTPLKEALIALTDALAKRPAEEILFQWFRSARLVGELSDLMKRRHPLCKPRLTAFTRNTLVEEKSQGRAYGEARMIPGALDKALTKQRLRRRRPCPRTIKVNRRSNVRS